MYTVIFIAELNEIDQQYTETAVRLRELAIDEYGCLEFVSVTEGNREISISYWNNRDQIQQWKQNAGHLQAQELGKSKWYRAYKVQVLEVTREYASR